MSIGVSQGLSLAKVNLLCGVGVLITSHFASVACSGNKSNINSLLSQALVIGSQRV